MTRKRARIIYNPSSGHEAIRRDLLGIMQVYEKAGYETSAYATTPEPFSARDEAQRLGEEKFDLIIAAGGDGTVNEVVNGIAPFKKRPKVAVIPGGTTNDYARALGINREDLVEAAKAIRLDKTIKMDIGQINHSHKYFMNIAALGTLSEITYEVPSRLKSLFGYLAYLTKGAELITRIKASNVHISYDGQEYNGEESMIFLALTNSVGGFEQIVPDAQLDDGKFTLLIIKKTSLTKLAGLIFKALNGGQHINDPAVIYAKAQEVVVESKDENQLKVNLDGEYGGDAPMAFTALKQHIEFIAGPDVEQTNDPDVSEASKHYIDEAEKTLTNSDED